MDDTLDEYGFDDMSELGLDYKTLSRQFREVQPQDIEENPNTSLMLCPLASAKPLCDAMKAVAKEAYEFNPTAATKYEKFARDEVIRCFQAHYLQRLAEKS